MSKIEVAVSPLFRGRGWTDRGTGIDFEQQGSVLKTRTIDLSKDADYSGIKNSVRLGHLIVIKGKFTEQVEEQPNFINPEELSGEQLDELVGEGGSDESLKARIKELESEQVAFKRENVSLVKENEQLTKEILTLKENSKEDVVVELPSKEELINNNTKAELVKILKDLKVEFDDKGTKADLADIIIKNR